MPAYYFAEIIISWFFNHKIKKISDDEYFWAAIYGFLATFLYASAIALSVVAGYLIDTTYSIILLPVLAAFMMALGNLTSTLIMGHFNNKKTKKTAKNNENNIETKEENITKIPQSKE